MSLIFDALQRSEGERSGVDLSELSAATELLQRVERQTVSEWQASGPGEALNPSEDAKVGTSVPQQAVPHRDAVAYISSATEEASTDDKHLGLFAEFHSLPASIAAQSQLVCLTDGESLVAEKFRFLGVRLRHLQRERPLKKILITSTIPREGKSTVSANLACTLARKRQQRTLLIEGDVRRPSLSRLFGLERMPGLCDWLQGDGHKITNIIHVDGPGLWILPAGQASGNPLEALQSGRLPALIDQLAALFDWIIIDSPPVLPLADTSVWSRFADGILLVARQGITKKRQLQKGLEAVDHKKLIGALLNCSQSSGSGDDYYYYRPATTSGAGNPTEK